MEFPNYNTTDKNVAYEQFDNNQFEFRNRSADGTIPITHLSSSNGKAQKSLANSLDTLRKDKIICRLAYSLTSREEAPRVLITQVDKENVTSIDFEGKELQTRQVNINKIIVESKYSILNGKSLVKFKNDNLVEKCLVVVANNFQGNPKDLEKIIPKEFFEMVSPHLKNSKKYNLEIEYLNILKEFNSNHNKKEAKLKLLDLIKRGFPEDSIKNEVLLNAIRKSRNKCVSS